MSGGLAQAHAEAGIHIDGGGVGARRWLVVGEGQVGTFDLEFTDERLHLMHGTGDEGPRLRAMNAAGDPGEVLDGLPTGVAGAPGDLADAVVVPAVQGGGPLAVGAGLGVEADGDDGLGRGGQQVMPAGRVLLGQVEGDLHGLDGVRLVGVFCAAGGAVGKYLHKSIVCNFKLGAGNVEVHVQVWGISFGGHGISSGLHLWRLSSARWAPAGGCGGFRRRPAHWRRRSRRG